MKHGISPTTNIRDISNRSRMLHLSKPLALKYYETLPDPKNQLKTIRVARYIPVNAQAPQGTPVQLVVAPVKGKVYLRTEPKPVRPGAARRARLADARAAA